MVTFCFNRIGRSSGGWQLKNKEMLQLEAPEHFLAGNIFLVEKTLLTKQILSIRIMEKIYIEKLSEDQKIIK